MSDQNASAVLSADSSTGTAVAEPTVTDEAQVVKQDSEYTSSEINSMIVSDDPEERKKGLELVEKIDTGELTLSPSQTVDVGTDPSVQAPTLDSGMAQPAQNQGPAEQGQAQPTASERKYFKTRYRGQEREIDDPDDFLGRKDVLGLKKQNVSQVFYISELEEQLAQAKRYAEEQGQKYSQIQTEFDSVRKQGASNQSQARPSAQPAPAQNASLPVVPKRPPRPDVPVDPTDWSQSDVEKMREFNTLQDQFYDQLVEYNQKSAEYFQSASRVSVPDDYETLKKESTENRLWREKQAQREAEEQEAKAEKEYWQSISNFQNTHEGELSTQTDIQALHNKVWQWGDRLASAMGYSLPFNPTAVQRQQYEQTRANIVHSYMTGSDPDLANRLAGIEPPSEYETYFKIAELNSLRNQLVADQLLGPKATLEEVWRFQRMNNLPDTVQHIEATAKAQGATQTLQALSDHQANHAVTVPNDYANRNAQPQAITLEEQRELLLATPAQLEDWKQNNPEKLRRRNVLMGRED